MINFDYENTIDQVRKLLLDYEIPPHLAGFNLIAEAVTIKLAKPYSSIKDIYSAVAAGCSRTVDAVIRNVNYAIKQSYNLGNILNIPKQQIFGGRVISVLAIHIKSRIAPPPLFCGVSYKQQKIGRQLQTVRFSRYQSRHARPLVELVQERNAPQYDLVLCFGNPGIALMLRTERRPYNREQSHCKHDPRI